MNRRGFFARCIAGALLGLARNLPLPAAPKVERAMTLLEAVRRLDPNGRVDLVADLLAQESPLLRDVFDWTKPGPGPYTFVVRTQLPALQERDLG